MLYRVYEIQECTDNYKWTYEIEADSEQQARELAADGEVDPVNYGHYGEPFYGRSGFHVDAIESDSTPLDPEAFERAAADIDKPTPPIVVIVSGGVVQNVLNVPPGFSVRVHDYDLSDHATPDELAALPRDAEGNPYEVLEF